MTMETPLTHIGLYQFENLINNRVPFLLLNFGIDLSSRYSGLALQHLNNQTKVVELEMLESFINVNKTPLTSPIVCLCDDGTISATAAIWLEKKNFINVFVVKGGWQGMN